MLIWTYRSKLLSGLPPLKLLFALLSQDPYWLVVLRADYVDSWSAEVFFILLFVRQ